MFDVCIKVCFTVSVRSVTSALWRLCFVAAATHGVCVHVCVVTCVSFPFLLPGLNVHDSPSLLLLTSTANRPQVLIADQQDSSSQRSRVKQLLTL